MAVQPHLATEKTVRIFSPEEIQQSAEDNFTEEQQYRAAAWSLLGALLHDYPDPQTLAVAVELANIPVDEDELLLAMSSLGLAAQNFDQSSINDEFQNLFIGLGRGEVVPYASWYLTGFLMEQPLSQLREALQDLGFERDPTRNEPEDHVAALCEVMSMLISDNCSIGIQASFFENHIASWCQRFFNDLEKAESASFYQAVGRFGAAFIKMEQNYLQMPV